MREPNWKRLDMGGARSFLRRFIKAIPARHEHLASVTDVSWVYSTVSPEDLRRPIRRFAEWLGGIPILEHEKRMGRLVSMHINDATHADRLKEIEREMREQPGWVFTRLGEAVIIDMAMLLGEFMRVRCPWLSWGLDEARISRDYLTPSLVVYGERKQYASAFPAIVVATNALWDWSDGPDKLSDETVSYLHNNIVSAHQALK